MSTSPLKQCPLQESKNAEHQIKKIDASQREEWGAVLPSKFESVDEILVVAQGRFDQRHY
jgi:hypothetical protein